jgi:hypothetical protein
MEAQTYISMPSVGFETIMSSFARQKAEYMATVNGSSIKM